MGRIVNPHSIRTSMNEIKSNVDEYSSHYKKAKSTIARYSFGSPKLKGMTGKAVLNQLYCYETLMDMFIITAENISKACDTMIMSVGDEKLNEDIINSIIYEQEGIKTRCANRIEDYRHKQMQLELCPILASYCGLQINRNTYIKTRAEKIIAIMNRKLEKIDEIERKTNELFLAEKAAMTKIGRCIAELKGSGKNGFRFQELPVWAADMEKQLFDKYNKEMLTKGRLNEDFVEKFSNLTIAEMTPAEFKAYQEYVKFLILKAKPEDMNKVIKHAYRMTKDGVVELKDGAYDLATYIGLVMKIYSMKSTELVDSSILEKCTIMKTALTRDFMVEKGTFSLKGGHYHYKYEYLKYKRPESNHAQAVIFTESYTTNTVYTEHTGNADKLGYAKNEYLKNLMRKDGADYAMDICKSAVNIGVTIAFPEMTVGEQVVWELANLGVERVSPPGKNEDFGIKSEGIATMTNRLKVRASIAKPGTKEGTLIYEMYPTSETMRRIEFYNKIFEHYKMDPIGLGDVCNNPEDVNSRILALSEKIDAVPYVYNKGKYETLDRLENLYKNLNSGEIK
ncbi:MAG: hypothetical protein HXL75_06575 [[Eubacterium] sulci]|nr:hypothetical protein [[Eubacterium] sulci]MBF1153087.1 hypothetical protein [[Eubacterium] sulci]MBF1154478.1 hypothetical protein [[Eubacterium] sulci]